MKTTLVAVLMLVAVGCIPKSYEPAIQPTFEPDWAAVPEPIPAPTLVARKCGCSAADCSDSTGCPCSSPNCVCMGQKKKPVASPYAEAVKTAIKQDRPLVVWIGQVCLACERSMPDYVHVKVGLGWQSYHYPSVMLGLPYDGDMAFVYDFDGQPSKAQIEERLRWFKAKYQTVTTPTPSFYQQPFVRPVQFQQGFAACRGGG